MNKNILIVGAGAAGLMAAYELIKEGFAVTIVEARDRTGGRIATARNGFSRPVEMGAEFVHGDQPLTTSLIKATKTDLSRLSGNHYQIANGQLQAGDFFNEQWNEMLEELQQLHSDMPMQSFMDQHFNHRDHPELYTAVKGFVEGFDAADLDKVSALALKEEWLDTDDEHQYHITGGYETVIRYLEEKIRAGGGAIVLSSPVRELQWLNDHVKVLLQDNSSYTADKVIITVPLGVLQRGDIVFTPALAKQEQAFRNIGFGSVIKFLFEFKDSFWKTQTGRRMPDAAFIFSDAPVPTWWSQRPDETPILTGWLGGPGARNAVHEQGVLFQKAIASLSYIFDCPEQTIKDHLHNWLIIDWFEDPYARGAYAYATVDTAAARNVLLTPVGKVIYFAGEAIYDGAAMGTVEAALASGKNAANKISEDTRIS